MYLTEDNINPDPIEQFDIWFKDAHDIGLKDPNAMNVASATKDGVPSSRMVLLKSYDKNGFIFYTNYTSRKSREIIDNPLVALNFFWDALERQVRVEGKIKKIDSKISDEYFASRARLSQLGAHASNQSEVIENYDVITNKLKELEKKFEGEEIPRPEHWGGFIIVPDSIEFWQGHQGRIHDRLKFRRADQKWKLDRLSP